MPRLDPMQFRMSMGNDHNNKQMSTPSPMNDQNLLPYLQILAPVLLQQHLQQQQQRSAIGIMPSTQHLIQQMQPLIQQPVQTVQHVQTVQPVQAVQPVQYVQPVQQVQPVQTVQSVQAVQPRLVNAQAYQIQNTNGVQLPQVIIVPQMIPQQQSSSASTNMPVQVEAPHRDLDPNDRMLLPITRRMLERPPKTTTRRPKVVNRSNAGTLYVQFATPRAPAGFRRLIIPPVTANIGTEADFSVTTESYELTANGYQANTQPSNYLTEDSVEDKSDKRSPKHETTTSSVDENLIESNDIFSAIETTSAPTIATSSEDTTNVTSDPMTRNHLMNKTVETKSLSETEDDLMEAREPPKESVQSLADLIHEDFVRHVENLNNQMDFNQPPQIYFENSKGGQMNDSDKYQLTNNQV